jgi:hypothetical protein
MNDTVVPVKEPVTVGAVGVAVTALEAGEDTAFTTAVTV